jgi:ABC-2 type transport system ATP-binding protein
VIEVKNVTKKYGSFTAVDDISFEVNDHEVVGFLGPNGAGKSTTMNMITGYIEPTKGKIIVNGHDISKYPIRAKKQIGYMPENVPLYQDLTVKEFVTYMAELKRVPRKVKKEKVQEVLKETGLSDVQNKLIKNVSRGYKQRVSLAGALIGDPEVLILDEPTVGLDPKQITEIRALIKNLGKKHTVILSSHILSEVSQICERVIIINHGKIVAIDTPENLENKTKNDNSIIITVEDLENKMDSIKEKIVDATEIKFLKKNEDATKRYIISAKPEVDIRKEVFNVLTDENITVLELKKVENSLEDAFLNVINSRDEEEAKIAKERDEKLSKMTKKERKKAIKEEKEKEFNDEWNRDKEIVKKEKEESKREKAIKKEEKIEKKKAKKERKENKKEIKEKGKDIKKYTNKPKEEKLKDSKKDKNKKESKTKKGGKK